jgi:hypothetical protein
LEPHSKEVSVLTRGNEQFQKKKKCQSLHWVLEKSKEWTRKKSGKNQKVRKNQLNNA